MNPIDSVRLKYLELENNLKIADLTHIRMQNHQ